MCKQDLALNSLQSLKCHQTEPNLIFIFYMILTNYYQMRIKHDYMVSSIPI